MAVGQDQKKQYAPSNAMPAGTTALPAQSEMCGQGAVEDGNGEECQYFVIGFFTALLIDVFVFFFFCCAEQAGIIGKKKKSFMFGAIAGCVVNLIAVIVIFVVITRG